MTITKVAVDPQMSNNAYLLHCEETDELVLIDAAYDAPTLLSLIGDRSLTAVVTTHQHWDHHRALAEVVAATGAAVVAGEPDAAAITEQTGVAVDRTVTRRRTDRRRHVRPHRDRLTGTPPARSRCSGRTRTDRDTSSPATRSSPGASATPSATRPPSSR